MVVEKVIPTQPSDLGHRHDLTVTRHEDNSEGHRLLRYQISAYNEDPFIGDIIVGNIVFRYKKSLYPEVHKQGVADGVTAESLYAVLIDMLEMLQCGPGASEHNEAQINLLRECRKLAKKSSEYSASVNRVVIKGLQ